MIATERIPQPVDADAPAKQGRRAHPISGIALLIVAPFVAAFFVLALLYRVFRLAFRMSEQ